MGDHALVQLGRSPRPKPRFPLPVPQPETADRAFYYHLSPKMPHPALNRPAAASRTYTYTHSSRLYPQPRCVSNRRRCVMPACLSSCKGQPRSKLRPCAFQKLSVGLNVVRKSSRQRHAIPQAYPSSLPQQPCGIVPASGTACAPSHAANIASAPHKRPHLTRLPHKGGSCCSVHRNRCPCRSKPQAPATALSPT